MLTTQEVASDRVRPLRRTEYDRLVESGAFEDEDVELLDGVIVRMPPPQGPEHAGTIEILADALAAKLAGRARVRVQSPFAAGDLSEPEPDIAVVPVTDTRRAHPSTAHLVVEVSRTSAAFDRGPKARIYAAAGVPEYWVIDLVARTVDVHTDPRDGEYGHVTTLAAADRVTLVAFEDIGIDLGCVL